jgi:hypothetical protein
LGELPFFAALVEGRFAHDTDEHGSVFVDRSGDLFAVILQYLRSRQRPGEPILARHATTLLDECAFYGLESLAEKIRGWTCPLDLLLSDRSLRERERSARDDPGNHKATLIDVHAAVTTPLSRESLELPLLRQEVPPPVLEGSFEDFWTRLNNFSGGLIEELADVPCLIVAGGAVIGALTSCPAGDIDIFLHTPVDQAEPTLRQIFEAVQRNQSKIATKRRLMVTRTANAFSFYRVSGERVVLPPVQV